jgi:hypothetical protein
VCVLRLVVVLALASSSGVVCLPSAARASDAAGETVTTESPSPDPTPQQGPVAPIRREESVEVTAPASAEDSPAIIPISPRQVASVAGGAEDVFRVVATLPGVVSANFFQGRMAVRGGDPDENLTVVDGVEIHNPFRLAGTIAAFNPDTIEKFDFSSVVFPARFGDRLSSLLLVETRDGTRGSPFNGSAGLSLTNASVTLEGRLPKRLPGSWLVSGRRTYYDVVAERFTDSDLPGFEDLYLKAAVEPRPGTRLSFLGLAGRESAEVSFAYPSFGQEQAGQLHSANALFVATARRAFTPRTAARVVASYYSTSEDMSGTNERDGDLLAVRRAVRIRDLALRPELTLSAGRSNTVELGAEWHRLASRWAWEVTGLEPTDAWQQSADGGPTVWGQGLTTPVDSILDSQRGALWATGSFALARNLTLEPTARIERSSVNASTLFAPRVAATWQLDGATRARLAAGIVGQSPGYEKVLQSEYFVELGWPASRGGLPVSGPEGEGSTPPPETPGQGSGPPVGPGGAPGQDASGFVTSLRGLDTERSIGALLGLERQLKPGLTLRAEAFYRRFDRLIVGRLETDEERRARLARYDFPEALAGELPTDPQITRFPVNGGRGRAYGFDLYLSRAAGRVTGWVAYSYGLSVRSTHGHWHPADFDCRHALSLVGELALSRTWRVGTTARVATGLPATPGRARLAVAPDVADLDGDGNREELIPIRNSDGTFEIARHQAPGDLALLNSARHSPYARIDVRTTWNPRRGRWHLYLDVINVLNHKVDDYRMMPLIPSIGVHTRF